MIKFVSDLQMVAGLSPNNPKFFLPIKLTAMI